MYEAIVIVDHSVSAVQFTAVRRATPADEEAIADLLTEVERQVVQLPLCEAVSGKYCYLLEQNDRPVALCSISLVHRSAARLHAFALHDDLSVMQTLDRLLTPAVHALHARGAQKLFYIGEERWLLRGLYAAGFHLQGTIILLQKTDFAIPRMGNREVTMRPATRQDVDSLLAVDEAAFVPPWQITGETFLRYLNRCPFFTVAELRGRVVGYACAYLIGYHGHLSRIAVHPRYSGRGIGTRLLAEAIRFFQREEVFGITLNTQADNHQARRLYEHFGFQLMGRDAWVLVRDIQVETATGKAQR